MRSDGAKLAWGFWWKVLAYGVMVGLALLSIWFINRRVDVLAR